MFALRASDVAFGNDVYCANDVTPNGVVGKHHCVYLNISLIMKKRILRIAVNNIVYGFANILVVNLRKQICVPAG